jgi:hypothetical protein
MQAKFSGPLPKKKSRSAHLVGVAKIKGAKLEIIT